MKILTIKQTCLTGLIMLFASSGALAIEPDQLSGRVLDRDLNARTLTLHLTEVGDNVDEPVNSIQTYKIPETVEIQDDWQTDVLPDDLSDIQEGEIVTLDLDIEDRAMARTIRYNSNQ